jgi:hypothetical protein
MNADGSDLKNKSKNKSKTLGPLINAEDADGKSKTFLPRMNADGWNWNSKSKTLGPLINADKS